MVNMKKVIFNVSKKAAKAMAAGAKEAFVLSWTAKSRRADAEWRRV
jgi:hypothetical protein